MPSDGRPRGGERAPRWLRTSRPSPGSPNGFVARLSRRTRVLDRDGVLVGGTPTRVSRLRPRVAGVVELRHGEHRVTVRDAVSRALAEHLLEAGMAIPVLSSLPPVPLSDVTVVVPTRDRPRQLDRLLQSLPAGLGGVIVVDSDVVVEPGSLQTLLRHLTDPKVALVAPRILGLASHRPNAITRYENARSSLDLGREAAIVRPRSPLAWVSGTCQVCRVSAIGDGYDASMDAGEDVDMVWRLVDAGHRVRYEPAAAMRHEHRSTLRTWLGQKFFYGTGAAPLADRHPGHVAPVSCHPGRPSSSSP